MSTPDNQDGVTVAPDTGNSYNFRQEQDIY